MATFPKVHDIQNIALLKGTVTSCVWSDSTLDVEMVIDEETITKTCQVLHSNQDQFWRKFYQTEEQVNPAVESPDSGVLAFCKNDIVLVVYDAIQEIFFVIGQHEDSDGFINYSDGAPPYVWPLWPNGIVAGFKNSTYSAGSDFPFLLNNNPSIPIAPYTDALGNSRAIGTGPGTTNPYGVLEKVSTGYIFHRQYEFCTVDNRLSLEPYDTENVNTNGDYTIGINVPGDRILFCGVPIAAKDIATSATFRNIGIINTCPLTLAIYSKMSNGVSAYTILDDEGVPRDHKYIFGYAQVYEFDVCLRDIINGKIPLPIFPDDSDEYTVPLELNSLEYEDWQGISMLHTISEDELRFSGGKIVFDFVNSAADTFAVVASWNPTVKDFSFSVNESNAMTAWVDSADMVIAS